MSERKRIEIDCKEYYEVLVHFCFLFSYVCPHLKVTTELLHLSIDLHTSCLCTLRHTVKTNPLLNSHLTLNLSKRGKGGWLSFPKKSMKKLFSIIKSIRKKMKLIQKSRNYFYMWKNRYSLARHCNISNSLWKPNSHSVIVSLMVKNWVNLTMTPLECHWLWKCEEFVWSWTLKLPLAVLEERYLRNTSWVLCDVTNRENISTPLKGRECVYIFQEEESDKLLRRQFFQGESPILPRYRWSLQAGPFQLPGQQEPHIRLLNPGTQLLSKYIFI